MKKRVISLLLAILMLCALFPQVSPAVSAANSGKCGDKLNWSYDAKTHKLTITGSGAMYDFDAISPPQPWRSFSGEITELSLPKGLTKIGISAFESCTGLTSVTIPEGVTAIGDYAFDYCKKLESVHLPDSLLTIGDWAFCECRKLKEITLPKNVRSVGIYAFDSCSSLQQIVVQGSQAYQYLYLICKSKDPASWSAPDNHAEGGHLSNSLGPHDQVVIYGYPTGADGVMRTEEIDMLNQDTGKFYKQSGQWAKYICDFAKEQGYKFCAMGKFVDVKQGDPCEVPVAWAVGHKPYQVTAGMDATHFAPTQTVTRAQAMTFFWAAQNKPKFKKANTQFVDVKKTDWFYKPVMWAVENGVTAGTDATHFSPSKTCNRGEILAFLYASLKKPKVSIPNPYKDVSNQWYKKAALWAYSKGIEKGESSKFNASTPCTRASVVTYLYRFMTGCGLAE